MKLLRRILILLLIPATSLIFFGLHYQLHLPWIRSFEDYSDPVSCNYNRSEISISTRIIGFINKSYHIITALETKDEDNTPVILLTGLKRKRDNLQNFHCVLKYQNGTTESSQAIAYRLRTWPKLNDEFDYQSMVFWCKKWSQGPVAWVSLALETCGEIQTYLPVVRPTTSKQGELTICVDRIFNYTSVVGLTEFVEYYKIMGVDKIILYGTYNISQQVNVILQEYIKQKYIELIDWEYTMTLGGRKYSYLIANSQQHILYIDCLYRYRYAYSYIGFLDTDEFIIPHVDNQEKPLVGLLRQYNKLLPNLAAMTFVRHLHCTGINWSSHEKNFLSTQYYTNKNGNFSVKSIVKPTRIKYMAVHGIEKYIDSLDLDQAEKYWNSSIYEKVLESMGVIFHYVDCSRVNEMFLQPSSIIDKSALIYNQTLFRSVQKVLDVVNIKLITK